MTQKKNYQFGLLPNGIIVAESGRYGTYLPDIIVKEPELLANIAIVTEVIEPIPVMLKVKWYHRFIQWLLGLIFRGSK